MSDKLGRLRAAAGLDDRCGLCGHRLAVTLCRWVYNNKKSFFVCALCDGETVVERWVAMHEEAK